MTLTDGSAVTKIPFPGFEDRSGETDIRILGGHLDPARGQPFGGIAVANTFGANGEPISVFGLSDSFEERAVDALGQLNGWREIGGLPASTTDLDNRAAIVTLASDVSGRLATKRPTPDLGVVLLDTAEGTATRLFFRDKLPRVIAGALNSIRHEKYTAPGGNRTNIQQFVARMLRQMEGGDDTRPDIKTYNMATLLTPVVILALLPNRQAIRADLKMRDRQPHLHLVETPSLLAA